MENQNEFEKLEDALTRVGRDIIYPKTPTISANARDWLGSEQIQRKTWGLPRRVQLTATLVLVVAFAFFIFPESRDAFAQFFGVGNAQLTYRWTPTMTIASTPSPLASTTMMLPTRAGTPSTQYHNPGSIQQIQPPRLIPQPTHP